MLAFVPITLNANASDAVEVQAAPVAAPLSVVASIKPLALIAKAALGSRVNVTYLKGINQSPHSGSLSVSVLQAMNEADMILYLGDEFEPQIGKAIKNLGIPSVVDATAVIASAQSYSASVDKRNDAHVWLSPQNANLVGNALQMSGGEKPKKVITDAQLASFQQQLQPLSDQVYITHHDMMGYFAEAFGLDFGIALRDAGGKVQGAKSQHQLRILGRQQAARCVFVEPQYKHKDAQVLASALDLPLREIDPMAGEQELTANGYYHFLVTFIGQFTACFE